LKYKNDMNGKRTQEGVRKEEETHARTKSSAIMMTILGLPVEFLQSIPLK
jgi:hypothetical protein